MTLFASSLARRGDSATPKSLVLVTLSSTRYNVETISERPWSTDDELAGAGKNSFHCYEGIKIYDRATSAKTRLTRDCGPRDHAFNNRHLTDHSRGKEVFEQDS